MRWATIGVLAAALAVFLGLVPFVGGDYYAHIGILVFLNVTLVLGYRLLCLTGLYSFCHIAFFGIGAYTSALLSSKLEYPVWICFDPPGGAGTRCVLLPRDLRLPGRDGVCVHALDVPDRR
jgi:ABC-type branched-subunit amino acid transport system permease subunit